MKHWLGRAVWLTAFTALHATAQPTPLRDMFAERMAGRQAAAGGTFELPRGASVERDIAYGDDPAQKLDVYRPAQAEGAPVIFMVHGGGWMLGDKGLLRSVKNKVGYWVGKGYVLVSINYRMLPQTRPLEQANDVAKALAFAQEHARSWGGDASRFVLMGHSSGAHLVSLLAADPAIAARAGAKPWLGTVTIDSAAFDVAQIMNGRHFGFYDTAFGKDAAYWRDSSPISRLREKPSAPWLAICSTQRSDSCPQARAFAAKADSLGGRVSVLPVALSHGDLNDQLGAPGEYTDNVVAFIHSLGLP